MDVVRPSRRVGLAAFRGVLALLGTASCVRVGVAQERVDLDRFRVCEDCTVEAVLDLRLGDRSGEGIIENDYAWVLFDEEQNQYAVITSTTHVKLFDAGATFLRVIGREGSGPGEFRGIGGVGFAGGNLIVLDTGSARWTVLSDRGEPISESRLTTAAGRFVVVSPDTVVVGTIDLRPAIVGYPLHLTRISDGSVLRHFGSETGEFNNAEPYARRVEIALGGEGQTVWLAKPSRLRFEEWSVDGTLLRVVAGAPDWFPPVTEVPELGERPPTRMAEFAIDRGGRLWVASRVADPSWEEVARTAKQNPEGSIADTEDYFDTRVDVFDLRKQTYYGVHRWSSDGVRLVQRGGQVLGGMVEYDDDLVPRVALYRLEIRIPTTSTGGRKP